MKQLVKRAHILYFFLTVQFFSKILLGQFPIEIEAQIRKLIKHMLRKFEHFFTKP